MAKLKPCPFCGSEGRVKKGYPGQQKQGLRMAFVQCSKCKAKTETIYQVEWMAWDSVIHSAMERWNNRVGGVQDG